MKAKKRKKGFTKEEMKMEEMKVNNNTMNKEEGIEWSNLVKKMDTINSQNIRNKTKDRSNDILEQRKKKKINCDSKNENYSENENEGNHYSEIDDICQNMPHFPTEPFTNFREEFAMTDNKI